MRKALLAFILSLGLSGFAPANADHQPIYKAIFGIDDFLIILALNIVISVISYVLAPKPPQQSAATAQKWQDPQAQAGMPVGVPFGTITITQPNVLWFGDKSIETKQESL